MSFDAIIYMTVEQKKNFLRAKIALALYDETGKVPTEEQIDHHYLHARVNYTAIIGLHYKRQEQKKSGQLAIF
jgi:hypothetical protein